MRGKIYSIQYVIDPVKFLTHFQRHSIFVLLTVSYHINRIYLVLSESGRIRVRYSALVRKPHLPRIIALIWCYASPLSPYTNGRCSSSASTSPVFNFANTSSGSALFLPLNVASSGIKSIANARRGCVVIFGPAA